MIQPQNDIEKKTVSDDLRPMELRWRGSRLLVATPLDFCGDPGPWTPTHAVVAAIANCLMTTFMALARASQLPVISRRVHARVRTGELSLGEAHSISVILEPEVRVIAEDTETAQQVFRKAVQDCFSSESLRSAIRVRPRVVGVPIALAC